LTLYAIKFSLAYFIFLEQWPAATLKNTNIIIFTCFIIYLLRGSGFRNNWKVLLKFIAHSQVFLWSFRYTQYNVLFTLWFETALENQMIELLGCWNFFCWKMRYFGTLIGTLIDILLHFTCNNISYLDLKMYTVQGGTKRCY